MRCFESFFKRTWRPQQVHQMDSPSKFEPMKRTAEPHHQAAGETTELGEVKVNMPSSSVATSVTTPQPSGSDATSSPCRNGGCKVWRSNRGVGVVGVVGDSGGGSRSESPWHSLKTIFLVSVIVAFLLWIMVYTLLDQYRIL